MLTDKTKHLIYLELIRKILIDPRLYDWSYQGLGMLRLYLGDVARIHIWDQRLAIPDVSTIHTHSWSLKSIIISGEITNQRFNAVQYKDDLPDAHQYYRQRLVCGFNSEKLGDPVPVKLISRALEVYWPGQTYSQDADEIHNTFATPGTITIMERKFDGPNEEADVFFREDKSFVSAKPRPATRDEVAQFTSVARQLLDQDPKGRICAL